MPKIHKYENIDEIEREAKKDLIDRHSPFVNCKGVAIRGVPFKVTVVVGDKYSHPDDLDHYISSISLFNKETKLAEMTYFAGTNGGQGKKANSSVTFSIILEKDAKLVAHAYCTKHGIWEGIPRDIKVVETVEEREALFNIKIPVDEV